MTRVLNVRVRVYAGNTLDPHLLSGEESDFDVVINDTVPEEIAVQAAIDMLKDTFRAVGHEVRG